MKDFICSDDCFSNKIITRELLQSVKSSHSRYRMYLEVQLKLNEIKEKLLLEKETEVVLMKERGERNFANENKQGHRVYKRMHPLVKNTLKGCK